LWWVVSGFFEKRRERKQKPGLLTTIHKVSLEGIASRKYEGDLYKGKNRGKPITSTSEQRLQMAKPCESKKK